jgi:hypothetical protein
LRTLDFCLPPNLSPNPTFHQSFPYSISLFFCFVLLGLELRSYPFLRCFFQDRVSNCLPRLASNLDPPDLCLLNSLDYRHVQPYTLNAPSFSHDMLLLFIWTDLQRSNMFT